MIKTEHARITLWTGRSESRMEWQYNEYKRQGRNVCACFRCGQWSIIEVFSYVEMTQD